MTIQNPYSWQTGTQHFNFIFDLKDEFCPYFFFRLNNFYSFKKKLQLTQVDLNFVNFLKYLTVEFSFMLGKYYDFLYFLNFRKGFQVKVGC
jgi:hypothetical protein